MVSALNLQSQRSEPARWLSDNGASPEAIASHYDVGNDFYALWLDPALIYTAALWDPADTDTLAAAQARKIDYYARALGFRPGMRVLDIGCGWGGALRRLANVHGASAAVGLTLSESQARYIEENAAPGVIARVQSWVDYTPAEPFDAIISVEAIEAFARQNLSRAEKVAIYRALFERAQRWLKPGGCFGLQMIAYGSVGPEKFDRFIAEEIFPQSDLPRLSEVMEAAEGLFEPVSVINDRAHYARTLRSWSSRLKEGRAAARALVGDAVVKRFEDYLRLSWHMFATGACDLHRIVFRRIDPASGRG